MSLRDRIACLLQGHDVQSLTLPEDGWGLYAISREVCKRCGTTTFEADVWGELGLYNAEVSRGVVHQPWKVERMAAQQEYFDEQHRPASLQE